MNIIFLTMSHVVDVEVRGIYSDLLRKFRDEHHNVFVVSPYERRLGKKTELLERNGVHILGVRTLNVQKTSIVEKGIGQVLIEYQFKRAIKKKLSNVSFDLILYSTPPITFSNVIKYLKKRNNNAYAYLLLKDIFPQNAVDIGVLNKSGIQKLIYQYFRKKEEKLYRLSDYIGCMSPANIKYVLEHNKFVSEDKVELAPNSVEIISDGVSKTISEKNEIRKKYNLPIDVPIFIYGGNLGKPQGISYLIDCLKSNAGRTDCHFLIIGFGTEYHKIKKWYNLEAPQAITLMESLPKFEYDELVSACDVGLIFLDCRFTIPNYPSRLLSYLENKMPVVCATDRVSDIGPIAKENGYGYWCESNSVSSFCHLINKMISSDRALMGNRGYKYLCDHYSVEKTFNAIVSHV